MAASMVVGTLRVTLHIPAAQSLKEKRMVVRSLVERLRRRFNVAVAEVGEQDTWQVAVIAAVVVSGETRHAESMATAVLRAIEDEEGEALLTESRLELIHV